MIKAATRACSLAELAERLGLSYKGDGSLILNRGAPLLAAEADSLTFFSPGQPLAALKATRAGAVIVEEHRVPHCPAGQPELCQSAPKHGQGFGDPLSAAAASSGHFA